MLHKAISSLLGATFRPKNHLAHTRQAASVHTNHHRPLVLVIGALCSAIMGFAALNARPQQSPVASQPAVLTPKLADAPGVQVQAGGEIVASDLAARVARYQRVKMPFRSMDLSHEERKMVNKLVDAAGLLDCIFWRQSDPKGLQLYISLAKSKDPQDELLRRYLKINGGRFDLIDDNKPFVGTELMPLGRGFFLPGETQQKLELAIKNKTLDRSAVYSPNTLEQLCPVEQATDFNLCFVPYHLAYGEFLEPMAQDLRDSADLSDDPAFTKFLRLRAQALLTDNYYASDVAWLELKNPKFDIIMAPYETYLDTLLGVKGSYGASVMIRNDEESRKLAVFQQYIPQLQEALPLSPEDLPSKKGKQTPMEVADEIYRSGDLLHGYQAVADNLPNDPRIQEEKGSKKIFWKNFMDARVDYIILPLAQLLMRPDQAALASDEGYMEDTLMHEISHGLGPAYSRTPNGRVEIREAIGPQAAGLEEAKADIVGKLCVKWFVEHGVLRKDEEKAIYASYLADIFRTVRFGIAEAHGAGEMMEFNYLAEQGAIRRDPATGLYEMDFDRMPAAMAALAKELLEQEATGDRARTESWFRKYAVMPPELSAALAKASRVPVDIDPDFSFSPPVQ